MIVTDVHMHIIPGVDDGSKSIQESITLLQRSVAQGVGTVIATPHSWAIDRRGVEFMLSRFEDLKRAVNEREIPVQLFLGCEMLVYADTIDDCIRKLDDGAYPTLAGSRYVLTEFDPYESRFNMEMCIQRIVAAGYTPVIAHAERCREIALEDVKALKYQGALIQINAFSIADEKNSQTRQLANSCLSERIVDFIGSDAHRLDHRPPLIKDGIDALIRRYTEEYAEQVAVINPKLLLK